LQLLEKKVEIMTSYKEAGVDINAGNEAEELIGKVVKSTYNKNVIAGVGAFGAAFSLKDACKMKEPVIVSTVDGVGTKLKIAALTGKWNTVGKDIVNHCSNDILAMGAKPLFFMDYIAAEKISPQKIAEIVGGMASACKELNCSLIGGETAEMPGVYLEGEHDVVGMMVGIVERKKIIDGSKIKEGDALIGLASTGLHTNGYSLARKVLFNEAGFGVNDFVDYLGCTIGEALLVPHKSYSKPVLSLTKKIEVKGIAHITGGGLSENVPRIMPKNLVPEFDYDSIPIPKIFNLIQEKGNISNEEMFKAFNMGVGLVLVVKKTDANATIEFLKKNGETAWLLGKISKK
jgi:phosphoribosylformylglycinamidine cyclo-ligase